MTQNSAIVRFITVMNITRVFSFSSAIIHSNISDSCGLHTLNVRLLDLEVSNSGGIRSRIVGGRWVVELLRATLGYLPGGDGRPARRVSPRPSHAPSPLPAAATSPIPPGDRDRIPKQGGLPFLMKVGSACWSRTARQWLRLERIGAGRSLGGVA